MSVTAALVKELREKSGAGMMDCKKALGETGGDMDAAIDWLRTKGLAAAAKKSGRVAAEGLVGISVAGTKGAVVELNAETDFVARNSEFQGFVSALAELALDLRQCAVERFLFICGFAVSHVQNICHCHAFGSLFHVATLAAIVAFVHLLFQNINANKLRTFQVKSCGTHFFLRLVKEGLALRNRGVA